MQIKVDGSNILSGSKWMVIIQIKRNVDQTGRIRMEKDQNGVNQQTWLSSNHASKLLACPKEYALVLANTYEAVRLSLNFHL